MLAQLRSAYASGLAQLRSAYVEEGVATDSLLATEAADTFSASGSVITGSIVVGDQFERSSINAALSEVTVDADSATLIRLRARMQDTSGQGIKWLEPVGRVSGVLGQSPRFEFFPFQSSAGQNRNHQSWGANQRPHFSYDNETWIPFDSKTIESTRLTFRHDTAFTQDTVYIARSTPRSVTWIGNKVASVAAAHPTKIKPTGTAQAFTPSLTTGFPAQPFIAAEVNATTDELGRAVPATPLYAFEIDDQAFGAKPEVGLITMGIHSGEDVGELVGWNLVEWLLGSSTEATALRRRYRIVVYPMMNPAGRYAGFWRGAPGSTADTNRQWLMTTPNHDCVTKAKAGILADTGGAIRWGYDVHSSPTGGRMQITANTVTPETVEYFNASNTRLTALGHSPAFAVYGSLSDSNDFETGTTVRSFQYRELGATICTTLECNDASGPMSAANMQPYAEALGLALYDRSQTWTTGVTGSLAATEARDTFAASGNSITLGTLAATEQRDTLAATGLSIATGSMDATEQRDTAAIAGRAIGRGSMLAAEASDTFAASGSAFVSGSLYATEQDDAFAAVGIEIGRGSLSATEARDQFFGSVASVTSGIVDATESRDAFEAIGNQRISGSMAAIEADDTFEGRLFPSGALSAFEDADTFAAEGVERILGQMAAFEAGDSFDSGGDTFAPGRFEAFEDADGFEASGSIILHGLLDATEAPDRFSATPPQFIPVPHRMAPTALRLITKHGQPVTLRITEKGEYDPATGTIGQTDVDYPSVGVRMDYEQRHIDGTVIRAGDQKLLLPPQDVPRPETGNVIVMGGKPFRVVSVGAIDPNGLPALYELQLRGVA